MHVLKDPDSHPEIVKMLRSLDLTEFNATYSSLATFLAVQLTQKLHSQRRQARQLFLKTQIFPVARRQQPRQLHLPNRKGSRLLKMLPPTSSVPCTLLSPSG